jgi:hypothetical protein
MMSTTTGIVHAVEIAEQYMANHGYGHGPCLGAKVIELSSDDKWEVEFAYEELLDRAPTCDPPSIILSVDVKNAEVDPVELM